MMLDGSGDPTVDDDGFRLRPTDQSYFEPFVEQSLQQRFTSSALLPGQVPGGFSPLDYLTLPPSYHANRSVPSPGASRSPVFSALQKPVVIGGLALAFYLLTR